MNRGPAPVDPQAVHPGAPTEEAPVDEVPSRGRWSPLAWLLRGLVRAYQLTAPMRTPRCRFLPTCSSYALEALRTHGAVRGTWLAVRRVGRCHPWNLGGFDPVPPRK